MTVRELIEELNDMPQDSEIDLYFDDMNSELEGIEHGTGSNRVYLIAKGGQ